MSNMRARLALSLTATAAVAALLAPSGAGAATEFGDNCIGNTLIPAPPPTITELAAPGNPLPTAAPSAGVLTKWRVSFVPAPVQLSHSLKVLRPTGTGAVQIIAEAAGVISGGVNSFDARIPIQAGDRLALFGTSPEPFDGTLICEVVGESTLLGGFSGPGGPVGTTVPFLEVAGEERVPVAGVLEPDADNDGFGDETQDKCPASAAVQVECPVIVLDSIPLLKKGKVVVLVATSTNASVAVSGSAKLPRAKNRARSSAQVRLRKVTKPATAGKLTRFSLSFPAKLKRTIRKLRKGRSLTLKLQASSTDVAGRVSADKANLKLRR